MFTLYPNREFHRECPPSVYARVMSPRFALEQAIKYYDLNPRNYSHYGAFEIPRRLTGNQTWYPTVSGYIDPVHDTVKKELELGRLIGIDHMADWDAWKNPFYIDERGNLILSHSDDHDAWYVQEIMQGFQRAVANCNGMKPASTQRLSHDYTEPQQHAQTAKTINSKAAGRLLAAGGIYNGNVEGFQKTAQQLGGDAPAGYNQVMDNKGLIITGTSVAAGLGIGRINAAAEAKSLSALSKVKAVRTIEANGKKYTVDKLALTGSRIDTTVKSGKFTVAGRALQKHGSREGSAFPAVKGNPSQINEQGQQVLDGIIKSTDTSLKEGNRFGGFDVFSSDGRGTRFDQDGNFRGFLEP